MKKGYTVALTEFGTGKHLSTKQYKSLSLAMATAEYNVKQKRVAKIWYWEKED